ncbi:hypothetical protein O77CONTIG1_01515 [Leptolyngbya sp. O-77]|nr:hypothetical protein O77CONTIG1_01515 [Leptolyngbya sp. O-77]
MVNKPLPREGSVCLTPQENAVNASKTLLNSYLFQVK